MEPRVSVIINTVDRAESLRLLLSSLAQVRYGEFEVIVVAGPSTDHTDDVLASHEGAIRIERCPERNLSMSRNIGVRAAATDFVAFIDDDAVPEPSWLEELMAPFANFEVAAVGGWVYDHTGHSFQCTHTGADRFGNARPDYREPLDRFCVPGAWLFPYAPGGNGVYRRDLLMAVGGFDEEFEYYLEETDLCLRLIDHGWVVSQVDGGAIHHKFLPSGRRSADRVLRDRFAVVKNKIYFSLVNATDHAALSEIIADDVAFSEIHRDDAEWHLRNGTATKEDVELSLASIDRAWEVGLEVGRRGRTRLGFERSSPPEVDRFVAFPTTARRASGLRLCFVAQSIPPTVIGGIGRYFLDLARELARRGHEIRIITTGDGHPTVDLEDGVWVHRIPKDLPIEEPEGGDQLSVPPRIASNAVAVADEVDRIASTGPIDAVYAAMWDVEQLEVLRRRSAPVVTALVTTFAITLRTRSEWRDDEEFMEHFGRPLLALERWVLEASDGLHAISGAIVDDVSATSGIDLGDTDRIMVEPIGEEDRYGAVAADEPSEGCKVIFIGRFEKRKGIDLLLAAVPEVLKRHHGVHFTFVGRDDLAGESGRPYRSEFEDVHAGATWLDRISFLGEVSDAVLAAELASADVLVAPSRFESFGLIYVEGMMAGLPVVAVREGAASEILVDGSTGILVPAQSSELRDALDMLVSSPELRQRLGSSGRERYLQNYSVGAMADRMEPVFDRFSSRRNRSA